MDFRAILIGHSQSGKTYFLGSMYALSSQVYSAGLTLTRADALQPGNLAQLATQIKAGSLLSSAYGKLGYLKHPLALTRGYGDKVLDLELTDIRGQAVDSESTALAEVGPAIYGELGNQDAALIFVKIPLTEDDLNREMRKLRDVLLFVEGMFRVTKKITPVALIFTQIDLHPFLKDVESRVETKLFDAFSNIHRSESKFRDFARVQFTKRNRGLILSQELEPVIYEKNVIQLIEMFSRLTEGAKSKFPNRVFFASALGFAPLLPNGLPAEIRPHGVGVSLLWTVYASLRANGNRFGPNLSLTADTLFTDIEERISHGDCYFEETGDPDHPWDRNSLSKPFFHERYLKMLQII